MPKTRVEKEAKMPCIKPVVFSFLSFWMISGTFHAVAAKGSQSFVLRSATSMEKLFKNSFDSSWHYKGADTEISISACRNEIESFQIAVVPFEDIKNIRWRIESKLPAENIKIQPVGYLNIKTPSKPRFGPGDPVEDIRPGLWPDPLYSTWQSIPEIKANEIQPIWVTIDVPKDVSAGKHQIVFYIIADGGEEHKCVLNLKIWDFEMPARMHLKTSFWYAPYQLDIYYKGQTVDWPMRKEFLKLLLDNRLTPVNYALDSMVTFELDEQTKKYRFVFSQMAQQLRFILDENPRKGNLFNMTSHSFIHVGPSQRNKDASFSGDRWMSAEHKDCLIQYLKAVDSFTRENGWMDYAYIGYVDEPSPRYYEKVKKMGPVIKETLPHISRASAITVPESVVALKEDIDIMVPGLISSLKPDYVETYKKLQSEGRQIWAYECYKTACIDYASIHPRMWFWLSWKYNSKGFLYWGTTNWQCREAKRSSEMIVDAAKDRWPNKDVWEPLSFDIGVPGDGYLIYPSPEGKPWSSIRLENIRDGVEDYEYLYMLKSNVEAIKQLDCNYSEVVAKAEKLLNVDDIAENTFSYITDPKVLAAKREALGEMLEKTNKLLKEKGK